MQKIELSTHDGEKFKLEVENYNAKELIEKINDNNTSSVEIGGIIFASIDIKRVVPIKPDIPLIPIEPIDPEEDMPTHPIERPEDEPTHPIEKPDDSVEDESDGVPITPLEPSIPVDEPTNIPEFGEVNIPELDASE